MQNMISFLFGSLLSGGRVFLALSAAGQASLHGYIIKHAWISAKLRGGVRGIKRRLAGSIWQGIAFRLPETSGHLEHPKLYFTF